MDDGWIKLPRHVVKKLGWKGNKLNAFVDLEMRRDFRTGNVSHSVEGTRLKWGWTWRAAKRFLAWFDGLKITEAITEQSQRLSSENDSQSNQSHRAITEAITDTSKKLKKKIKNTTTPPTPQGGFNKFWENYPRKAGKANAVKAWNKLAPDDGLQFEIILSLAQHKTSEQWRKDSGQFIPHAASWLNQRRWEDELEIEVQPWESEYMRQLREQAEEERG